MFIALLGFEWAGLVADNPAVYVQLGDIKSKVVLVSLTGLILTSIMVVLKVRGSHLMGNSSYNLIGLPFGIANFSGIVSKPPSISSNTF